MRNIKTIAILEIAQKFKLFSRVILIHIHSDKQKKNIQSPSIMIQASWDYD